MAADSPLILPLALLVAAAWWAAAFAPAILPVRFFLLMGALHASLDATLNWGNHWTNTHIWAPAETALLTSAAIAACCRIGLILYWWSERIALVATGMAIALAVWTSQQLPLQVFIAYRLSAWAGLALMCAAALVWGFRTGRPAYRSTALIAAIAAVEVVYAHPYATGAAWRLAKADKSILLTVLLFGWTRACYTARGGAQRPPAPAGSALPARFQSPPPAPRPPSDRP